MTSAADKVRQVLRSDTDALGFLDKLDDEACAQLTQHLQDAGAAHHHHIAASMREALNHFPRLLRGPVKKLFGM